MSTKNDCEKHEDKALSQVAVSRHFVNVKLKKKDVEDMISTYEFFVWNNRGEEKKISKRILKALQKSIY